MALNDNKRMAEFSYQRGLGAYNMNTDVFKYVFITEVFSAIDETASSIGIANFTKVTSAGNYVQDAILANSSWTRSGNVSKFTFDNVSFAADPANPDTAKTLAIYNDTSAGKDVLKLIDLTVDNGVTAADTKLGFNWTVNAAGSTTTTSNA